MASGGTYTNLESLKKALLDEMETAMNETAVKAKDDMDKAIEYFYSRGPGDRYVRTYTLAETPKTTNVKTSGNESSFEAYLDKSFAYYTGKEPSMGDVLNLTNDGITSSSVGNLYPAVGRMHYWEKAEENMEKTLNKKMKKHFPG